MEHLSQTASGALYWRSFSYAAHWPWLGGLGVLVGVQVMLIVVLLRLRARWRRSEQALRQTRASVEQVQSLVKFAEEIPGAALRIGADGRVLYANNASAPLLATWGCQLGQRVPEDWRTHVVTTLASGQGREVEVTDGDRVFSYILTPAVDRGYVNVYGRDISARKRTELELRRINRALSALRTCSQILIRATDETMLLRKTCQAIVEVAGYRLAWIGLAEHDEHKTVRPVAQAGSEDAYLETVDITWADTERGRGPTGTAIRTGKPVATRDLAQDPSDLPWRAEAVRRGYASSIALPLVSNDEVLGALNLYAAEPNAFDAREMELLQELANDLAYGITAQRTRVEHLGAEEALRKEKERVQLYLDVARVIFVVLGADQKTRLINRRGCEVLGYDEGEVLGRNWFDTFVPARFRDAVRGTFDRLMRGDFEPVEYYENPLLTRSGEERIIAWRNVALRDETGRIVGTLSSGEDITERKRADEEKEQLQGQLYRAQKMEAIGQLAGGLAHDFNNILTAILGNVELLRGLRAPETAADDPWLVQLDQIERASQHAAALTRQILAFGRRQPLRREVLDLNRILGEMMNMLGPLIGEHITSMFMLAPQLARVQADAGQLEQVVMNLVVNARDAMPNGGKVMIETSNVLLDDAYVAARPAARSGRHVLLTVSDTGHGMSKEVLERIFEPFFTTKPVGQGTGLGLPTVYGIVKQFDGHIAVDSEPGCGSTFKIYLPAAVGEGAEVHVPRRDGEPQGGTETILVCEDDDTVREITVQFLKATGYTVLAAANGQEALELAAAYRDPLHLLLTDVVMPGINGKQLATAMGAIRPEMKTLYMSGYTADVIADHGVLGPGVELLQKPFRRGALLERVRLILSTPSRHHRT